MTDKTDNLIIFGSPHQASLTAALARESAQALPGNTVWFDCFATPPLPCDDCGLCKTKFGCRHRDLDTFFEQFAAAKHIVFASPVYNGSVPAPMKALLDRFQQFYNARFSRGIKSPVPGKRLVTVVLTMGGQTDVTEPVLAQLRPLFTVTGCRLYKTVTLTGTDRLHDAASLHPIIVDYPLGECHE